jgi:SAM-dependent methyltransferase
MAEIVLPKRRFALLRRTMRECTPDLYGWMLENATLRRVFGVIKGKQRIVVGDDPAQRFTAIYENHYWEDDQSRSGGGSNLYATEKIRKAIPSLFLKYGIRSVLDIPCGDFFWFKEMKLNLDTYIGADIVVPLIASVAEKYTSPTRSFRVMDLTKDTLPDCDLVLVRDCFIHLSFESIFAALRNITQSKIRYLLTTHYADVAANVDIETGSRHHLNLCAPPFNFSSALELIDDYAKGLMPRQLGLWRVDELCYATPIGGFSGRPANTSGHSVSLHGERKPRNNQESL